MDEVEIYSFDNKDYVLVTKIDSYLYLSNEKDPRDMICLLYTSCLIWRRMVSLIRLMDF